MSPGTGTGIPAFLPQPAHAAGLPWHPEMAGGDAKAWYRHSPEGGGAARSIPGSHPRLSVVSIPKNPHGKSSPGVFPWFVPHRTRSSDPLCRIVPCGHSDTIQRGWRVSPPHPKDEIPLSQHLLGGFILIFSLPGSTPRSPLCRKPPEIGILELLHKGLRVLPTFCHLLHLLWPWGGG